MTLDWRTAAENAEKFFALLGMDGVDQRLERIAVTSRALHSSIEAGFFKQRSATVSRWAVRHLDLCARTFCRPPPAELVQLIERLLGVDGPVRDGQRKNPDKFKAAAEYVARHQDATPAQIARVIKYDQKRVIATWLENPEFQEIVNHKRARFHLLEKEAKQG